MPPATVVTTGEPANAPLAPLPGAANVTLTPERVFPPASFTVACRAVAKAALTCALWGVPAVAVMVAGGPGLFVKLKLAGDATPSAIAVTVYAPAVEFAVNAGATAMPVASVGTVDDPANVPPAP